MSTGLPDEVPLLQALVAAEHAAVYGYGLVGAHLPVVERRAALGCFDAHRVRRDQLTALLRARQAEVPPAQGGYAAQVDDRSAALGLAVRLEEGLAVRWRDLVAGADGQLRELAASGLADCAVRAARWRVLQGARPPTVALPGQP